MDPTHKAWSPDGKGYSTCDDEDGYDPKQGIAQGGHKLRLCPRGTKGRYVFVAIPGRSSFLTLCEVQVYGAAPGREWKGGYRRPPAKRQTLEQKVNAMATDLGTQADAAIDKEVKKMKSAEDLLKGEMSKLPKGNADEVAKTETLRKQLKELMADEKEKVAKYDALKAQAQREKQQAKRKEHRIAKAFGTEAQTT